MQRSLLHGTIHRAAVTAADLHHVGSLTLDRDLTSAVPRASRVPERAS